jgi:hypothetical protein
MTQTIIASIIVIGAVAWLARPLLRRRRCKRGGSCCGG